MKVRIEVLECKEGYNLSVWGGDSGSQSLTAGQSAVVEGSSVSASGGDGVGTKPVADANNSNAPG